MAVRLEWEGKPTQVERLSLPFQTVETINESRATREREAGGLFAGPTAAVDSRNLLVWGDNKLVMSSLLADYAGQVKLVHIDPPFDTGADFSMRVTIGDGGEIAKEPSILEEHAYRDTWGSGIDSYLSMIYTRLVLVYELLADNGSLYLHVGPNVSHSVKLLCDEIFGAAAFRNEIVWRRTSAHSRLRRYGPVHDVILYYVKGDSPLWNPQYAPYDEEYIAWVRGEHSGEGKSDLSTRRSVPMAERLARELDRWSRRTLYGADDDLVFAHPQSGRPLDRSKLGRRFKAACADAGVRAVRFHDLRHTFATRLAASGQPMRTIQEFLGHADSKTTQIYAHYAPSAHEVEMVNAAFVEEEPTAGGADPVREDARG